MLKTLLLTFMLFSLPIQVASTRYNYSFHGRVIHSAPGMTYATSFNAQTLGIKLSSPEDFEIYNDQIYMVDSVENALVVINRDFEVIHVMKNFNTTAEFENRSGLTEIGLKSPFGIDVKESGIYIADTGNNRIVKLNHDFEVMNLFSELEDITFTELAFEPIKITVDPTERMYVVARNVYEGIVEVNHDGAFNRFTGVNPIRMTPIEIFRRSLMTEAQLAQLKLYLPTEYTNVSINERNFIYATSKPSTNNAENMIQLINPKGVDVIKRNGYHPPMGDVHFKVGYDNYVSTGPSVLVDIANTNHGIYTVLDQKRSRLFTYDSEGNLLYVNGDEGAQSDRFADGVALGYLEDDLLVLDRRSRTMIVYRLTDFGKSVNLAIAYHALGDFDQAAKIWEEVIRLNTNYEIAYNGIGKYLLRDGHFKEAMHYFRLGHDRYYYSKAFRGYRNEIIKDNFGYIVGVIVLGSLGLIGLKIAKTYRKGGTILYED